MRMEGIEETIPELETGSIETNHIKQQRDNKRMNKQTNKQKQTKQPIGPRTSPRSLLVDVALLGSDYRTFSHVLFSLIKGGKQRQN